jgi:exosortase H (IPTLxxWG-CTERM-specific)
VGLFGLLLALFYALYIPFSGEEGPFGTYLGFLANVCGAVLQLFGQNVTVNDRSISSSEFSIMIVRGCDGIEAMGLFAAAVLASPVALRYRISFLAAGVAALVAVNILRAVTLFCIGVYFPKIFERVHFEAWPGVLIVAVLTCWLIWARWAARKQGLHTNAPV